MVSGEHPFAGGGDTVERIADRAATVTRGFAVEADPVLMPAPAFWATMPARASPRGRDRPGATAHN